MSKKPSNRLNSNGYKIAFLTCFMVAALSRPAAAQSLCTLTSNPRGQPMGNAPPAAVGQVNQILQVLGYRTNIVAVYQGNVGNAAAIPSPPRIVYNPYFMNQLQMSGVATPVSVLAHEVGHFVGPLQRHQNPQVRELDADCISGIAMRRMGASLQQAVHAQVLMPSGGSPTHPPTQQRINAITKGFQTQSCP